MKTTLIIGATPNPHRYAYKAANKLVNHHHQIINIGVKNGTVGNVPIEKPGVIYQNVDTVTLYINPTIQPQYYDYILDTKPKRVIFNPGTENIELVQLLEKNNIEAVYACTLVLLSTGQY